jgi:hypothetical protein
MTVFIAIVILSLIFLVPEPPVTEFEYARKCLAEAVKNNADVYSSKLFNDAKSSYDSALVNWQKQNQRFIFIRDYQKVTEFAELSAEKAKRATENSINNTLSLRSKSGSEIDSLNHLVKEINKLFNNYPLESETRSRISKGKMLLKEAEISYSKQHYLQAARMLNESEYLLKTSFETASDNLKNYFKSYGQWKKLADRTIMESRRSGSYAIIVDKFSRKLYIYQKGNRKKEFNAELGKNWVGDKRVKGDHATPEGMYRVTKKLDSRKTKYYKALLLNYPNEEDLAMFKSEIQKGTLPSTARIGGLIEIHGNGGKGIDWTEGCVALDDKEMDAVYRIAVPGTPVTIIGSMIDLPEILNE